MKTDQQTCGRCQKPMARCVCPQRTYTQAELAAAYKAGMDRAAEIADKLEKTSTIDYEGTLVTMSFTTGQPLPSDIAAAIREEAEKI